MKAKSLLLLAVAVLCLAMAGCKKDTFPYGQEVLFHRYYINFAWGYSHSGFFIDKDGNIKTYYQTIPYYEGVWNFPDNEGFISEDKMNENLEKTELSDKKIDWDALYQYASKISSVKYDDYTEMQTGCDGGAMVNSCYLFDKKTKTYREIILSQNGDWTSINNNSVAKEIDSWLKTIFTE